MMELIYIFGSNALRKAFVEELTSSRQSISHCIKLLHH
jgi:hypothetical protein